MVAFWFRDLDLELYGVILIGMGCFLIDRGDFYWYGVIKIASRSDVGTQGGPWGPTVLWATQGPTARGELLVPRPGTLAGPR